jgi:hypothetical protein
VFFWDAWFFVWGVALALAARRAHLLGAAGAETRGNLARRR